MCPSLTEKDEVCHTILNVGMRHQCLDQLSETLIITRNSNLSCNHGQKRMSVISQSYDGSIDV